MESLAQDLRTTTRGDVWLFGGGSAMGPFIDADLVDTIEIAIIPIVLGAGIRLFDAGLPTRRFDLRSVEHAAAGYALLKMARRRADTAPG